MLNANRTKQCGSTSGFVDQTIAAILKDEELAVLWENVFMDVDSDSDEVSEFNIERLLSEMSKLLDKPRTCLISRETTPVPLKKK